MKKNYAYIILIVLVLLLTVIFVDRNTSKEELVSSSEKKSTTSNNQGYLLSIEDDETVKKQAKTGTHHLEQFAFEMSYEICQQEQKALFDMVEPKYENLNIGDTIPLDKDFGPELKPEQAIAWLKKTSQSKCSSFSKDNAQRLFFDFELNEKNLAEFYRQFNIVLSEYRGFSPYRLIRKALNAYSQANSKEAPLIRDAILFSVATNINDASKPLDLNNALHSLRVIKEKGLIAHVSDTEIMALEKRINQFAENNARQGKELIDKYYPKDFDFINMTGDDIIKFYGLPGTKELINLHQNEYNQTREFVDQLKSLLEPGF